MPCQLLRDAACCQNDLHVSHELLYLLTSAPLWPTLHSAVSLIVLKLWLLNLHMIWVLKVKHRWQIVDSVNLRWDSSIFWGFWSGSHTVETTVLKYSANAIPPVETLSTSDKFSLGLKDYLCFFIHLLNMVILSTFAFQLFVLEISQLLSVPPSPYSSLGVLSDVYSKLDPLFWAFTHVQSLFIFEFSWHLLFMTLPYSLNL